jgi:hypothetical protein
MAGNEIFISEKINTLIYIYLYFVVLLLILDI